MIKSIMGQTYKNWELIIVDDGSDVDEYNSIKLFIQQDKRCNLIRRNRDPKNGNTCRNIGMDMAKGKYLLIFDSDDIIIESCIEQRVAFMENHPECDYASFPYGTFIDGAGDPFNSGRIVNKSVTDNHLLQRLLSFDYPFTVWSNIYIKERLQGIIWDEKILVYQDLDFMISCILAGLKYVKGEGKPDYYYRKFTTGQNVSGNFVSNKKIESTEYLFDKILSSVEPAYRNSFKTFVFYQIERLLKGKKYCEVDRLIQLLSKHYDSQFIILLSQIKDKSKSFSSDKFRNLYTHRILYKSSGIKQFRAFYRHELLKAFIPNWIIEKIRK